MLLPLEAEPYPHPNPNPNLLVSFSAWAELVWQYLLEVTTTVNTSSTLKKSFQPIATLTNCTLTLSLKTNCDVDDSIVPVTAFVQQPSLTEM